MYITFKSLINFSDLLIYLLHTVYSSLGTCVHVGAGFLRLGQNQLRINHFPMNFVLNKDLVVSDLDEFTFCSCCHRSFRSIDCTTLS